MSGGGGRNYLSDFDAKSLIERIQNTKQQTQNAELDAQVSNLIAELLSNYNNRNTEEIQQHLNSIKEALEKEIEGSVDLIFGGSVSRHTYVDGLSDVDSLVILNNSELANEIPETTRKYIAERLQKRFPNTEIQEGSLAVTVNFAGAEIQLIPSVYQGKEIAISNRKGDRWLKIKPKEFAQALSKVNERNGMKVVPMIKTAKGINSKLPQNQQLKSYHIESLAIEAFKKYSGKMKTKNMLQHFFSDAASRVMSRIKDKTGQTIHVDDYLGNAQSAERRVVSNALNRISRKMNNADTFSSFEDWADILS